MEFLRFALLSTVALHLATSAEVYKDNKENKEYILADLLTPYRPNKEVRRMYPHVIPFSDMGHPAMRSYQFGFPEALRVGYSSRLPQQIVFFANHKLASSISGGSKTPTNFNEWLQARRSNKQNLIPVPVEFERLLSADYDIDRELFDKLLLSQARPREDLDHHYMYRDHNRDFLMGLWDNWRLNKVFHDEEQIWKEGTMKCSDEDVLCLWRRYFIIYQSTKISIGLVSTLEMPIVDNNLHIADSFAASFWFAYCKVRKGSADKRVSAYCPNPCRNNPCADMAYTLIDSCEMVDGGLFENDFKCICVETAMWSKNRRECVMTDPCKVSTPCVEEGTRDCEFNPLSGDLRCHCKAGYMGHDCGQLQDACFKRSNNRPTGNRACNVEGGSLCIPFPGTNHFKCLCSNGWLPEENVPHNECNKTGSGCFIDQNCQRPYDPCMSLACEIGDCVSSSRAAMCQCPVTHYGSNCAMRRGHWSAWGPWSSCDPDCGDRRVRHRSRACLGLECLGQPFESAWCPGWVDCGVPERLGNYPTDRWRTAYVLRNMLTALAIGTALSMGAILACQCCLSVVFKHDRGMLDGIVWERAHTDHMMTYRRLSYKSAMRRE